MPDITDLHPTFEPLSGGAASSQERPSTKRRRRASLRYQAVMGVGQGESWKEADCHTAVLAHAATIADPVVSAVMRLFGPPAKALNFVVST